MSSPVNQNFRMPPEHFNFPFDFSQESEIKRTDEVSRGILNTNLEPSSRKRARQEGALSQRGPIIRLKIPRILMENSRVQQSSQPDREPLLQTISSNLDAPINDLQLVQEFVQSRQIVETPFQLNQEIDPKKLRPLSDRAVKDARQVIWDKMHGLPVNDQRLEHAEKTLQEYEKYESYQAYVPKEVPKEPHNLSNQRSNDRKRAWALAAAARTDASEKAKQRARRLELYMKRFSSERQAFIRAEAEEIIQGQLALEQQESEGLRGLVETALNM